MKKKKRPSSDRRGDNHGTEQRVKQRPHLEEEIRINKFIAHAGFCSRRDADDYILQGKVYVNDKQVTGPGIKVKPDDRIVVDSQEIRLEPFVYILLNKGKDTISTTDDERGRNTVLDAIENATGCRVYPAGRLDRDTMGLLLLTNDGDLAHRLMHPAHKVRKVYEVHTDRPLSEKETAELAGGVPLDDGPAKPHRVRRDAVDPGVLEITVLEGRNHLVRRMIGYFGTDVVKLKRVKYGSLTDAGLRVTRWRYLKQKEINDLRRLVKLKPLDFRNESV